MYADMVHAVEPGGCDVLLPSETGTSSRGSLAMLVDHDAANSTEINH